MDLKNGKNLPLIAPGEPEGAWCTRYSEPDAGSDFADIRTRVVRDGDEYAITGQKIWTSAAHHRRWIWLAAVRDARAAGKDKSISIFIVDMKSKNITLSPLVNYTGYHLFDVFNEAFFDNVRVPKGTLVGKKTRAGSN